jgi:crotonobetainyl-CoA:carnitine CoA-transferase CaiB-like acyl-CoA transferase
VAAAPPLTGLRVVDTTDQRGALGARLLADLGADVIVLEPPGGAASRHDLPQGPAGVGSLGFAWRHANKRAVTADLSTPGGRAVLDRLLAGADVWVDGHSLAERHHLGIDLDAARAAHPWLIVVSVTDFGLTGPYAEWPATDATLEAVSGMLFKAGIASKPPLLPPTAMATDIAGVMAAIAAVLAVIQRNGTGGGQLVDLAVMTAAAATTDWSYPNASIMRHHGMAYNEVRQGGGFVYPVFRCADGFVRMIVLSPRQWRSLVEWMGSPEEWLDPHWEQFINRLGVADVLCGLYEAFFADKGMIEICTQAQARGIVCTPVLSPSEVLTDGHLTDRGTFGAFELAPGISAPMASGFFEVDGTRLGPRQALAAAATPPDWPATERSAVGPGEPARPLAGLRVLDFGIGGVGVEAARLLAEYGADVIKVESRSYPDFIRLVGGSEMSPSFAASSRSKRSLGINLKTQEGLSLLHELVAVADVIIENSTTGTMADLGVDFATCQRLNPALVMVSSQLVGSHGRNAGWIGYGPSTQPYGGLLRIWDYDDDDAPAANTTIYPDHLAGRLSALAALAGVVGRAAGGGSHWEVAQVEAVVNMLAEHYLAEGLEPGSARPVGVHRLQGKVWGPFPCAGDQQWAVVCIATAETWQRFATVAGLASPPAFDQASAGELRDLVGAWTATRRKEQVEAELVAAGVPAGAMRTGMELLDDPHLASRGWTVEVDQPGVGPMRLEGPAFVASGMLEPYTTPAPGLGEHTRVIAAELLGLAPDRIEELVAAGVLEVSD